MPTEPNDARSGSLLSFVQIAGGLIALGALLPLLGVGVRWLSFSLDLNLRAAAHLALHLPPAELAFVGGKMLLSFPTSFFALYLLLVVLALGTRIEAGRKMRTAGRRIEERSEQIDKLASEVSREVLSASPARTRVDLLRGDLLQARQQIKADLEEMEHQFRTATAGIEKRSYPVKALGFAFSSRWILVAAVAWLIFAVLSSVAARNFPVAFAEQISLLAACLLLITVTWWHGIARAALFAGAIAFAGASVSAVWSYRCEVATYEWSASASLTNGRYALVAASDDTKYVVSCDQPGNGVVAVPANAVVRVTFVPRPGEPLGPSLLDPLIIPGSSVTSGPLRGCNP